MIKVTLNEILDAETFAEIQTMVAQKTPAATAIKILLAERRTLAAEVETLQDMLQEYKTLTSNLQATLATPSSYPEGTFGDSDRSKTDGVTSQDEEIVALFEGF
jgi:hypothetical protein